MNDSPTSVGDIGELALIREFISPFVDGDDLHKGDDCAHITSPSQHILWSIDPCPTPVATLLGYESGEVWGNYTATINLSDIAASGGSPLGMLVSLEMPETTPVTFLNDFHVGLTKTLSQSNVPLLGGNVKTAKRFSATGTVLGTRGLRAVTRKIKSSECTIYMVGSIGRFWAGVIGNHLGWGNTSCSARKLFNDALISPKPQSEAGKIIGTLDFEFACIDCSDGLGSALHQLSHENSTEILIDIDPFQVLDPDCKELILLHGLKKENFMFHFGDWQLVCQVPNEHCKQFERALSSVVFHKIGKSTQGNPCITLPDGRTLQKTGMNFNFQNGYNSVKSIEDVLNRFMHKNIF